MKITMKKYLIALAAMVVAVSSCTEKMSSGDKGDKVQEQVKLVKRITRKSWTPSYPDNVYTLVYDFSYDEDNRIVKIARKSVESECTYIEYRTYSGNTAKYMFEEDGNYDAEVIISFEGKKVVNVKDHDGLYQYLYENNSEKVTSIYGDEVCKCSWDKNGNMINYLQIQLSYTNKVNKTNIEMASEDFLSFPGIRTWIDRNVFPSICSEYLVEKIDRGSTGSFRVFSYEFDSDGCPIAVYITGDNTTMWYKYELEYY